MIGHIKKLFDRHYHWITLPLLAVAVELVTLGGLKGIPDNRTGLLFAHVGMAFLVIAVVYPWLSPSS